MLQIWTAKIGINHPNELNVSRKSGDALFAPTWDLVTGYKSGKISNKLYTDIYLKSMAQSYLENVDEWNALKEREEIVLSCYCRYGVFCHRHLLGKFMGDKGIGNYQGEI